MNKKSKELGLKDSQFVTPHGLDSNGHYTNAYELGLMTNYLLRNVKLKEIVNTKRYVVKINEYTKELSNTNELLGYLNGVYGVKTGFTNGANRCLVTAVKRGELDLICVVLGADTKKDRTKDSINLIEYVYKNYKLENIEEIINNNFKEWNSINEKRIIIDKGVNLNPELELDIIKYTKYPLQKEDINKLEFQFSNIEYREAPINRSEIFGTMKVKLENEEIFSINIINKKEIEKRNVYDYFINVLVNFPLYLQSNNIIE